MPKFTATIVTDHPKHQGREVLAVVGTIVGTATVQKVSLKVGDYVVIRPIVERTADGRGKITTDVRVTYAASTLEAARAYVAKHGGGVWERHGNTYRRVPPTR